MSKRIEVGEDLSSSGLCKIAIVNPSDRDWTKHRYVLAFGAYGWTRLMVWANDLDSALDECAEWMEEHAPGLLADDSFSEEVDRLVAEGATPDEAHEAASADLTALDNGHFLLSHEWTIVAEDPSRADLLAMLGRA